jgi:diguanylate cyclase (GGDEF)-like protein/PAS domain S-box-containing protein
MSQVARSREIFWKEALDSARQGVWDYDIRTGIRSYSETWRQIRGLAPGAAVADSDEAWLHSVHPDDRPLAAEQTRRLNAGELAEVDYEYRERHALGHWVWIMCRGRAVAWDDQGRPYRFIGIDADISPLKSSEERNRAMARRLELALSSVQIGIFVFRIDDGIVEWDWRLRMIYGLPNDNAPLPRDIWERRLHPEDYAHATSVSYDALKRRRDYDVTYRIIRQNDGAVRYIRSKASYQQDLSGGPILVGVNWDATEEHEASAALRAANALAAARNAELEEARARMEHNALHDALTGLANRRMLDRVMDDLSALPEAGAAGGRVAVLQVDLDRFKQINDVFGHDIGDFVLCHIAGLLRDGLPTGAVVARVGGDEFCAVVPDAPEAPELALLAEALIARCAQPVAHEGAVCRCGMSVGVALGDPGSGRDLFISADLALYRAKAEGRGRVALFTDAMRAAAQAKKRLSDDILAGIERDEFFCVYQPQVKVSGPGAGGISGVEALVRWQSPSRGLLAPADFLDVAEEMDVLAAIDRSVLSRAAADFAAWAAAGVQVPRLSVNLSKSRLRDPLLAQELAGLDMPLDRLSLELLESNYLDDHTEVVAANLQAIGSLGIAIEVDDFGTGHASIVSLLKLRPARLKIDRALIGPIAQSPRQAQLVRSIVEIGHLLGIAIIAEGVETEAQKDLLVEMGCDELQGFALAPPLTGAEVPGFLRKARAMQVRAAPKSGRAVATG